MIRALLVYVFVMVSGILLVAGVSSLSPEQVIGTVAIVELVIVGTLLMATGLRWLKCHERSEYRNYSDATRDPVDAPYVRQVAPVAPKQIEAPREAHALEVLP